MFSDSWALGIQFITMSGLVNIITLQQPPAPTNQRAVEGSTVSSVQYLDMTRTLMSLKPEKQVQSEEMNVRVAGRKMIKPHSQVHLLSSIEKCKVGEDGFVLYNRNSQLIVI